MKNSAPASSCVEELEELQLAQAQVKPLDAEGKIWDD